MVCRADQLADFSSQLAQALPLYLITMVALEMVLPALGGYWLDKRNGTSYWATIGVVVGLVAGMWHLLLMTRAFDSGNRPKRTGDKSSNE